MKIERQRKVLYLGLMLLVTVAAGLWLFISPPPERVVSPAPGAHRPLKLYWFIPDGLRADHDLFDIFRWADEGGMPNLKKMMARGTYGYSRPVFPGHTPTNFATLLTGSTPRVHGIADGPMHIEGYPLEMVSKGGFSSVAKKVPPIWYTLEDRGLVASLLSVPGATPPELDNGITIKGRWGGWGIDFPAVIFHNASDKGLRQYQGLGNRVFNFGSELTRFVDSHAPEGWRTGLPLSFSPPREVELSNWGVVIFGLIFDSTDDGRENYDRMLFSFDKGRILADIKVGEWSGWLPVRLNWELQNDYNIYTPKRPAWERGLSSVGVDTEVAINVVRLAGPDSFRVRMHYNDLNSYLIKPSFLFEDINRQLGPMLDFPDNYPPATDLLPGRSADLPGGNPPLPGLAPAHGFLSDRPPRQRPDHP